MEYLTSAECAEKWNVSQRWVAIYCKEGRIEGAIQKGRMWFIPVGTETVSYTHLDVYKRQDTHTFIIERMTRYDNGRFDR